jgi:hypothetical protein
MAVILDVNSLVLNKCLACQITVSSLFINPVVVPAMAFSWVDAVEIWCRFMLRLKSKTRCIGAAIKDVR